MERLKELIKGNIALSAIILLFILFGLAHLYEPIIYAFYAVFAFFVVGFLVRVFTSQR